jgi:hypothetical protein
MRQQTLIKTVEAMDKTQQMKVLQYLHDDNVKLCEGADGTRINLSVMPKKKYTALVKFVKTLDVKVEDKFRIE